MAAESTTEGTADAAASAPSGALKQHIADYLASLAHERRLAANTLLGYRRDLEILRTLAAHTEPDRLNVHDIRRFVSRLHSRGLDPKSIARALSAWRGLFRFLCRHRGYTNNPCSDVRAPRSAKRLPNALSPDEAKQLLDVPADGVLAVRDKAMFELFYSSGLRLSELTGLAPGDVDRVDGTVRVTGKGSKTRIVPVGAQALSALDAWLHVRSGFPNAQADALFLNQKGTRLMPRAVQRRLREWALKQGIATRVHPHVLRHSFASHVLQSSGDLRAVQEMLGHASISTTQIYTHLDFQHLAKVYDAAHPRARKRS